jgi:polar amino acid transport system substrate-binding protein
MRSALTHRTIAFAALFTLGLAACGNDEETTPAGSAATETAAPAETGSAETGSAETGSAVTSSAETGSAETGSAETTAAAAASISADCAKDKLALKTSGKLTVGTDSPAFEPWFKNDDPKSGEGFESAVTYAIAKTLGFAPAEVTWIKVPFDSSFAPGDKPFDFNINQVSITEERKAAVDFSKGYYNVNQAIVALADSPIAGAKTLDDLRGAKLGAQVNTTSLAFINEVVQPTVEPYVYNTNSDAKSALDAKQIDGIVLDLPTAFYVSAVEIEGSKIVGQFAAPADGAEQFGLVFQKDNPLRACVDEAITALDASGELAAIQTQWLSDVVAAPVLK